MSKFVDEKDRLELLKEENGERYYLFRPGLLRLYPSSGNMRKMNCKEILLHLIRLIHGYKIYILTDENNVVKGSILYSNGGSYRYPFATKDDLIDGPSYTVPEYRGQGVAVRIGNAAMNQFEQEYNVVYGTIDCQNEASIRRVKKNGFEIICRLQADVFRRFRKCEKGNLLLVAYKRKQ